MSPKPADLRAAIERIEAFANRVADVLGAEAGETARIAARKSEAARFRGAENQAVAWFAQQSFHNA